MFLIGLLAQSAERGANNAKVVCSILTQAKTTKSIFRILALAVSS